MGAHRGELIDTREAVHSQSSHVTLHLLGEFSLTVDKLPVSLSESCKRMLALLALNGPMTRHQVAGTLWPDCCEARAMANLRTTRWRMTARGGPCVIEIDRDHVSVGAVRVDAVDVERLGWTLVRGPASTELPANHLIFADVLLPGWYEDWVLFERERLSQLHRRFAEALTYELLRRRRVVEALDVALHLVAAEPLHEGGQRALIAAHCAEGEFGLAHRQLERYRRHLASELGAVETRLDVDSIAAQFAPRQ